MHTLEQRRLIAEVLRKARPAHLSNAEILRRMNRQFQVHVYGSTVGRILKGGNNQNETHSLDAAHRQDATISVLARFFKVDLSAYRPSFVEAPHLYFPESPAFRPFQRTWIYDCLSRDHLWQLRKSCEKAIDPLQPGKTDGHDGARLAVVLKALALFEPRTRPKTKQSELPLTAPASPTTAPAPRSAPQDVSATVKVAEFLDTTLAALRQLAAAGLSTAAPRAEVLAKAADMLGG